MQNLLDNTLEIGKVQNNASLIYSLVVGIFWCAIGYYWYKQIKNSRVEDDFIEVSATIVKADCKYFLPEKSAGKYSCDLGVTYEIHGKKYSGKVISNDETFKCSFFTFESPTSSFFVSEIQYGVGSKIMLLYSKSDPNIIKVKPGWANFLGKTEYVFYLMPVMLLIFGLSQLCQLAYRYYMVNHYDTYASLYGTGAAFGQGFKSPL